MFHMPKVWYSETNAASLCLGIVSKDFLVDNIKNTGLHSYVHGIWFNHDNTDVDMLDIHKYLMEKNDIKCLDLLKKCLSDYYVL